MKYITFAYRTTKTKGTIKLRFRLRDGRDVQLFHKSDIEADLADLGRFGLDCKVKHGSKVYNMVLEGEIDRELDYMSDAYDRMVEQGKDLTSEVFERTIEELKHPIEETRSSEEPLYARFKRYADEAVDCNLDFPQIVIEKGATLAGLMQR